MKKRASVITHTEIISRAADSVLHEIHQWEEQAAAMPAMSDQIKVIVDPLVKKFEALKEMYRIETGEEYE
jgi:hypothetical protein